ncbi:hypothetical protein EYZ11_013300 [Aspergillus tanneri]|uniref:Uncharacterized protein n=1 Tax=Aspergillus tanneri TaxID=1220188 RepID=A0A4S3IY36_9EURO|nr:hypothetical protein EYZ11_013300 [Aspergillus tanneri]
MGTTFNKYGLTIICDRASAKDSLMDLVSGTQKIPEGESIDLVNSTVIDEIVDRSVPPEAARTKKPEEPKRHPKSQKPKVPEVIR